MKYLIIGLLAPLTLWAQPLSQNQAGEMKQLWRQVAVHTIIPVGAGSTLFLKGYEREQQLIENIGLAVSLYGFLVGPSVGQIKVQDRRAAATFTVGRIGVGVASLALSHRYQKNGLCNKPESDFDDPCDVIGWSSAASVTVLALWDVLSATRKLQNGQEHRPRGRADYSLSPQLLSTGSKLVPGTTLQLRF
ncbi:MAG TPA: hypothetical protein DIW24_01430 [Bacteroidetes bacterium]|nr:hypothetical protein [Bacteroidota bacterium]HRR07746.1 hypothetical protein [Rhodothermales bacterium]